MTTTDPNAAKSPTKQKSTEFQEYMEVDDLLNIFKAISPGIREPGKWEKAMEIWNRGTTIKDGVEMAISMADLAQKEIDDYKRKKANERVKVCGYCHRNPKNKGADRFRTDHFTGEPIEVLKSEYDAAHKDDDEDKPKD